MGCSNFAIMEKTIITAYDMGLRGKQLTPFLEAYRGLDMDCGNTRELKTKDNKRIYEIITEEIRPDPLTAEPLLETDYEEWWEYENAVLGAFRSFTQKRFGWG